MVLRLAGPLQSWGEHSTFTDRDTLRYPTCSGITGIFAAAQGLRRGESLERYAPLSLTVRVDRPGVHLADFHTTGGGLPRERTVPTAAGGRRAEGTATIVTRRMYLSDAVFTVAVEGPCALTGQIAAALRHPCWQPYLGRRSCPPDPPLLLHAEADDPVADLYQLVPLPRRRTAGQDHIIVDMITETPSPGAMLTEVADVPAVFSRYDRRYRSRAIYRHTAQLPAALARWRSAAEYHRALAEYARRPS
ncbi:MAG: type I-E CRISPR-associated protein Cas5/CasD [Streptosporangiaceae bacterium]